MSSANPQQVFNFTLIPANTFETFYTKDPALVEILENIASRELNEPQIFLWGERSTGKTHVLQAICHIAHNSGQRMMYMPLAEILNYGPESLEGLHSLDIVCIDDIHLIAHKKEWELALFNLINQLRASNTIIVISSQQSPAENAFDLADLNSRSVWGPVYKLPQLNDSEIKDALNLHAKTSGLKISDDVGNYLLTRYQRDLLTLVQAIEKLNQSSLQEQRKITIPFVKKVLAIE